MFKRLLLILLMVTSAPLHAREQEHHRYEQQYRRDNTVDILTTALLGVLINQNRNTYRERRYYAPNQETYCYRELAVDMYGRTYYKTICE